MLGSGENLTIGTAATPSDNRGRAVRGAEWHTKLIKYTTEKLSAQEK